MNIWKEINDEFKDKMSIFENLCSDLHSETSEMEKSFEYDEITALMKSFFTKSRYLTFVFNILSSGFMERLRVKCATLSVGFEEVKKEENSFKNCEKLLVEMETDFQDIRKVLNSLNNECGKHIDELEDKNENEFSEEDKGKTLKIISRTIEVTSLLLCGSGKQFTIRGVKRKLGFSETFIKFIFGLKFACSEEYSIEETE